MTLAAQEDERLSTGATIGWSARAEGDSDQPYLGPGFGGSSLGAVVFVDASLSSTVRLGAEASFARSISGVQRQRAASGNNTFDSRHRDSIVSGVVKVALPVAARVQTAVGGGLGFARRQTERDGVFSPNVPPFVATPVSQRLSDTVLATTAAFDVAVSLTDHAALLALIRVHYLLDDDRLPDGVVQRGVSSLIFRTGAGARVCAHF